MVLEIESSVNGQSLRLEETINTFISRQDNDQSKVSFEIKTLKDEVQTLYAVEYKSIEKLRAELEDKMMGMKADNK